MPVYSPIRMCITPFATAWLLSSLPISRAAGDVQFALSRWAEDGQRIEHWNEEGQKQFAYRAHGQFEEDWYVWWTESIDGLSIGPDGLLYAAGNDLGTISLVRLDPRTGLQIEPPSEVFATFQGAGRGGMAHGPDGNLYVAGSNFDFTGQDYQSMIRTFDGESGKLIGQFQVGDNREITAMMLGPDGEVHVAHRLDVGGNGDFRLRISRFDFAASDESGSAVEEYGVSVGPGERYRWGNNFDTILGPDGNLYVSDLDADAVLRYDATTGQIIDQFIDLFVTDLTFVDDRLFGLTQFDRDGDSLLEFDLHTGAVVRTIINGGPNTPECEGSCFFNGLVVFATRSTVPEPSGAAVFLAAIATFALLDARIRHLVYRQPIRRMSSNINHSTE